jgi:hypothetical protein
MCNLNSNNNCRGIINNTKAPFQSAASLCFTNNNHSHNGYSNNNFHHPHSNN